MKMIWLVPLGLFLFMFFTWAAYLSVMNLMENRAKLTVAGKCFAYPLAAVGVTLDVMLNMVVGTIIFLEFPRELMFTARLQRHIEMGTSVWRARTAHWLCTNLLDPFDSRGYHCRKP